MEDAGPAGLAIGQATSRYPKRRRLAEQPKDRIVALPWSTKPGEERGASDKAAVRRVTRRTRASPSPEKASPGAVTYGAETPSSDSLRRSDRLHGIPKYQRGKESGRGPGSGSGPGLGPGPGPDPGPSKFSTINRANPIAGRESLHVEELQQRADQGTASRETSTTTSHSGNGHGKDKGNKAGAEDTKTYGGVKYERKQTGLFQGQLASKGAIITIDGEDYVEYRVLTKLRRGPT